MSDDSYYDAGLLPNRAGEHERKRRRFHVKQELPEGWSLVRRSGRPKYRRRDGYIVTLTRPGVWGIHRPGEGGAPMKTFEEQFYAMEWTNAQYPLEVGHG